MIYMKVQKITRTKQIVKLTGLNEQIPIENRKVQIPSALFRSIFTNEFGFQQ